MFIFNMLILKTCECISPPIQLNDFQFNLRFQSWSAYFRWLIFPYRGKAYNPLMTVVSISPWFTSQNRVLHQTIKIKSKAWSWSRNNGLRYAVVHSRLLYMFVNLPQVSCAFCFTGVHRHRSLHTNMS